MAVGVSNVVSKAGTTDIPIEMLHSHAQMNVWDDWDFFRERSPIYHVEKARTPILILHGFLQTHHFPTVRQLADSLAGLGYPVLTPSLSLGLHRRNTSLACEAIHAHSMQKDAEEVGHWVDWLQRRYQRKPVLIGHSAGSVTLLAYLIQTAP